MQNAAVIRRYWPSICQVAVSLGSPAMNATRSAHPLRLLAAVIALLGLVVVAGCTTITPQPEDWVREGEYQLGDKHSHRRGWSLTPLDAELIDGAEAAEKIRNRHYFAVKFDLLRVAVSGDRFDNWDNSFLRGRRSADIDIGFVANHHREFFMNPIECPATTMRLLDERTFTLAEAADADPWLGPGESAQFVACWYLGSSGIDEGPYTLYLRAYKNPKGWLTFDLGHGPDE